jgi:hypothetical protein
MLRLLAMSVIFSISSLSEVDGVCVWFSLFKYKD